MTVREAGYAIIEAADKATHGPPGEEWTEPEEAVEALEKLGWRVVRIEKADSEAPPP